MSRAQMAELIGVSDRVLEEAEHGSRPRPENALKIATYFGHRVTDLWPVEPLEPAA
jgi:DNA-binding XRE family transcriptional regulator